MDDGIGYLRRQAGVDIVLQALRAERRWKEGDVGRVLG